VRRYAARHAAVLHLQRAGRFPAERLITTYPLESINEAVDDMDAGKAIKAVLVPPTPGYPSGSRADGLS
jgi:Zn-dependent alcohol dehydrogenase